MGDEDIEEFHFSFVIIFTKILQWFSLKFGSQFSMVLVAKYIFLNGCQCFITLSELAGLVL